MCNAHCKFCVKYVKFSSCTVFEVCRCKSGEESQIFRHVKMPVYNANRRFIMCGIFCTVWHKMKQNRAVFSLFCVAQFCLSGSLRNKTHLRCKFCVKYVKILYCTVFEVCRCKSGAERQIFRPVKMPVYNANRRFIMCGIFCTVWHKMKQNRAVFGVLRYTILFIRQFQRQGGICVAHFCSKGEKFCWVLFLGLAL